MVTYKQLVKKWSEKYLLFPKFNFLFCFMLCNCLNAINFSNFNTTLIVKCKCHYTFKTQQLCALPLATHETQTLNTYIMKPLSSLETHLNFYVI